MHWGLFSYLCWFATFLWKVQHFLRTGTFVPKDRCHLNAMRAHTQDCDLGFFRITVTLVVLKNTNQWTRWGYCLCLCHQKHSLLPPPGCPSLAGWQHTLCHHLDNLRHLKKMEAPGEHACEPALCRTDMAVLSLCKDNSKTWHQKEKV